jgi:hypothetical protein
MRIKLLAFILTLASWSQAQQPRYGPAAVKSSADTAVSVFVGHYGEVLEFSDDFVVQAKMSGLVESVYFYPKLDPTLPPGSAPQLFEPKPSDFKPENFERLNLRELVIVPKDAPGGYRTLAELEDAKHREFDDRKMKGGDYRWLEMTGWSSKSFEILIYNPARHWQIYSETKSEFYIFTTGREPNNAEPLVASLNSFVMTHSTHNHLEPGEWKKMLPDPTDDLADFLKADAFFLWLLFMAMFIRSWRKRLTIVSLSMLVFANGLTIFSYLAVFFEATTRIPLFFLRNDQTLDIACSVLAAMACLWGVISLRARNPKMSLVLSLGSIWYFFYSPFNFDHFRSLFTLDEWIHECNPMAFGAFYCGSIIGFIFGLTIRPASMYDEN